LPGRVFPVIQSADDEVQGHGVISTCTIQVASSASVPVGNENRACPS
jgi:hypothetical protein